VTPGSDARPAAIRLGLLLAIAGALAADSPAAERSIAVVFRDAEAGTVAVTRGALLGVNGVAGTNRFRCPGASGRRVILRLDGDSSEYGSRTSLVEIGGSAHPFAFFLRDVDRRFPIYIPAYGAAVTEADDPRSFEAIASDVRRRGLRSKLAQIESEPEEGFDDAAAHSRANPCETWLGLSRDVRIFSVGERLDWIQPRNHGYEVELPENEARPVRYELTVGRGWGVRDQIVRRLEDGALPILHATLTDDDVTYAVTCFASLEAGRLAADTLRGTPFRAADHYGLGLMLTPEDERQFAADRAAQAGAPEETVLYFRAVASNPTGAPRYAFFRNACPAGMKGGAWALDGATGLARYRASGRVFAVSRLNGRPLAQEEVSVLLAPGGSAVFDLILPHQPIPEDRALRLSAQDFEARRREARAFWRAKLDSAARVRLPEARIQEMLQAGLLHLDLVTYGLEPGGTLAPTIGIYGPIGSESAPIVQFMDSMGWHDEARRALEYFLEKQHPTGFMQNFSGYMLETGAALWSMGEHYRYTRDDAWVRRIEPELLKACAFIRSWRRRNQVEGLRGRGYGLLEGKVADPEDPYRSFMLNGYHYLGMSRVAEMLARVDPAASAEWGREAAAMREDIRRAASETMARSPVVPLGDGTWVPTLPPWVEGRGPLVLYAEGGRWYTHGAMVTRDSLLGPLYLAFQEVLDPGEPMTTFLLEAHGELLTDRNAAFSQPYYSRHDWVHLRRGEVKPFLMTYYNTVAGLADRETYTFWEHYFHQSPHKTHEEAWFLMETRWMLYMERGDTLELLPGVPRAYLKAGGAIELDRVASYFGPLSVRVEAKTGPDRIEARVACDTDRRPREVDIRLPDPLGRRPLRVEGGDYDPATERVRIPRFAGSASVAAFFD